MATASNGTINFTAVPSANWVNPLVTSGDLSKFLASTNYLTKIKDLRMVCPRPSAELRPWSIYKRWVAGHKWRAPIGCVGGSFPYIYKLSASAPSGMTINGTFTFAAGGNYDYGSLEWTTPTAGTHSFTVTAIDQRGESVITDVTLVVEAISSTNFIWVNGTGGTLDSGAMAAGNDSTGDGSYATPFASISGWYQGEAVDMDDLDATYAGCTVIYRGTATYTVPDDHTTNALNFNCDGNGDPYKPIVHIGYPSEAVTLDFASGKWRFGGTVGGWGDQSDFTLMGMTLANEDGVNFTNTHQVFGQYLGDRAIWWDLLIKDYNNGGTANNDNNNAIGAQTSNAVSGRWHDDWLFKNIRVEGMSGIGNGGACKVMDARYCLMEDIQSDGTGAVDCAEIVAFKHSCRSSTMRLVKYKEGTMGISTHGIKLSESSGNPGQSTDLEVEYCCILTSTSDGGRMIDGGGASESFLRYGIRRCTATWGSTGLSRLLACTSGTVTHGFNVGESASAPAEFVSIGTNWTATDQGSTSLGAAGDHIDSNGLLTGASRTSYLGKRGWEISE